MALTYTLIQATTLTADTSTVDFTSIPSSYTDLVVRVTARTSTNAIVGGLYLYLNNSSASYTYTNLQVNNAVVGSTRKTGSETELNVNYVVTGTSATSNTFGVAEIYIPSYTASQNKPLSVMGFGENNATNGNSNLMAGLWSNTAAVTSVKLVAGIANFVTNSSFQLYGILKA